MAEENNLLTPGTTENKERSVSQAKEINLTQKMFQGQGSVTFNGS